MVDLLLIDIGSRFEIEAGTFLLIDEQVQPPFPGLPVTVQNVIRSYLYTQYADDDDLQAFVAAYNAMAQDYVTWFNALNLPIYTSATIVGPLLDWVAQGLYGMARPSLTEGSKRVTGPFNTLPLNSEPFNFSDIENAPDHVATSDDTFKRILTWAFYKGDGRQFNIRWLKRRIFRFLQGTAGTDVDASDTDSISVALSGSVVTITLSGGLINQEATLFAQAVTSGALELPFQFTYVVVI